MAQILQCNRQGKRSMYRKRKYHIRPFCRCWQNGDSRKKIIALSQSYFAVKTRQQELIENFDELDEDKKRLAIRYEMIEHNKLLVAAPKMLVSKPTRIMQFFRIMDIKGCMAV